jgi:hypothetical protein
MSRLHHTALFTPKECADMGITHSRQPMGGIVDCETYDPKTKELVRQLMARNSHAPVQPIVLVGFANVSASDRFIK